LARQSCGIERVRPPKAEAEVASLAGEKASLAGEKVSLPEKRTNWPEARSSVDCPACAVSQRIERHRTPRSMAEKCSTAYRATCCLDRQLEITD